MAETLSIAYVFDSTYKPAEGVPRYIETLGDHFKEQGHDVSYFVGDSYYTDPNIHSLARMTNTRSNGNHIDVPLFVPRRRVEELLNDIQPDVLHIQAPYGPLSWRFLREARDRGETAVIGTFHTVPKTLSNRIGAQVLGFASKRTLQRFDQMVSISPAAAEFANAIYGIETEVIPCPVDLARFREGRRLPEYDDGKTNIVFMGRLEERKGCQYLISAISLLDPSTISNLRVLIAGRGPLLDKLQQQAKDLGIDNIVSFLGFVDDDKEADFLASADIAVFPATGGESFGIVLTEAIASGAGIVLGGDNAGYRYVLGDNRFLIDPTNEDILAQRLASIISDPMSLVELHAVQQKGVGRFDISVVGSQVMDIYKTALEKRKT